MEESTLMNALELEEPAEEPAAETAEETPAAQPEQKQEQSPEERSRQAHARRIREAEEAGRRAAQAEFDELLAGMGLTNPKTQEAVDTYAKLRAYGISQSDDRLASGQGTAADIRRIVREETRPKESADPMQDPRVMEQLAQIKALDPEMTDLDAILKSEVGEKFTGYVQKGLDFVDAYTLAARDRLAKRAEEAARTKAASKDHLTGTQSRGTGSVSVPADIAAEYRMFDPDISDADIAKHYNKYLKSIKK